MTTDYETLWTQAAAEHKDANERFAQASKDSTESAFRELVFAAASNDIVTLMLGSSDQGEHMLIVDFVFSTGEGDKDVEDDLWAAEDLPDHYDADWTKHAGVTADFPRSGTIVTIDVKAAAEALVAAMKEG